jgi:hypothetical protein
MTVTVDWMGAQADGPDQPDDVRKAGAPRGVSEPGVSEPTRREASRQEVPWQNLPAHNFTARLQPPTEEQMQDDPLDRNPDLWMYRSRTAALLKRYMRFSLETGRLPSFMGREVIRAKITCYTAVTFEDRVIFVRDVEMALERLGEWDQELIARHVLQEYEQEESARILNCGLRTIERRFPQVLDLLSEDFLRTGLLAKGTSRRRFSQ